MVDNFAADVEPLTFTQCRAEVSVAIAEQFLAKGDSGDAFKGSKLNGSKLNGSQLKGSERCQLMLHVHTGSSSSTSLSPNSAHLDGPLRV
jgi:hypothetical protein